MTFKHDEALSAEEAQKRATHDSVPPKALLERMTTGWKAPSKKLPAPVRDHAAFERRRRVLSERFPGEVLVVPTGKEKVRANDTHYRFRPGSDFYWLTGNVEPDCVLVLVPEGSGHRDVLFVEPNPGKTDATFFTDRVKGELWVGPRLGVEQSRAHFAVHEAKGLPEFQKLAAKWAKKPKKLRVLRGFDPAVDSALPPGAERDAELAQVLSELRLRKDAIEVRELSGAIASTKRGFEDVIRQLAAGGTERHVEGVFGLRARVEGNDVGYGTIAAAGHHACVLHWTRNDGPLKKGDLLLLDAGVEANTLYTADVTRTVPVSGRYTKEQREIYQLVLDAQHAAMKQVKPGNDFLAPNRAAMEVLAHGLERLGILDDAEEALKEEHQFYKRYTLHNVSHMLGLDVHDCAKARAVAYKYGKLEPGMVLTIEPGLYFQLDDLTVPAKYRGIGVRIEDDVLVTARGVRNLSASIPKEVDEVEAWMAELWKK